MTCASGRPSCRYARETVLDAGSMARRRVARDAKDLALVLQRRLAAPL